MAKKGQEALLLWCKNKTIGYPNVSVDNFTTSWADGLAFCALIDHFRPGLINMESLKKEERSRNLSLAFKVN
jgi:spectrin beta